MDFMSVRKIWEDANGPTPVDSNGRYYDLHPIDGDNSNVALENLQCLSSSDHANLHQSQSDIVRCLTAYATMK